ncbi:RNA polymerase sigma factor [Tepidibacter sp. Z1-5]|uniref:RNA polymerase sigma factor n=1 Tax=Tepidibacter sp. Z1-5 TaxID=3134138 RepID=UPI0030BB1D84
MAVLKSSNKSSSLSKDQKHILYKTYYKDVFKTIYYFTKDKEVSKELTNEAYIKAFEKYDNLDEIDKFKPWICRIGLNIAKNYVTRNNKITLVDDTENLNLISENMEDEVIDKMHKNHIRQKVRNTISKLDVKYKEVIFMRYYNELSYNDISEKLDLNINTVKSRVNRAKEKLYNLLNMEGDYNE